MDRDPEWLMVHRSIFKSEVRSVSGILQKFNGAKFVWKYVVRQDTLYDVCKAPSVPFLINRRGQVVQLLNFEDKAIKVVVVVTSVTIHVLVNVAMVVMAALGRFWQVRIGYGKECNAGMVGK